MPMANRQTSMGYRWEILLRLPIELFPRDRVRFSSGGDDCSRLTPETSFFIITIEFYSDLQAFFLKKRSGGWRSGIPS